VSRTGYPSPHTLIASGGLKWRLQATTIGHFCPARMPGWPNFGISRRGNVTETGSGSQRAYRVRCRIAPSCYRRTLPARRSSSHAIGFISVHPEHRDVEAIRDQVGARAHARAARYEKGLELIPGTVDCVFLAPYSRTELCAPHRFHQIIPTHPALPPHPRPPPPPTPPPPPFRA